MAQQHASKLPVWRPRSPERNKTSPKRKANRENAWARPGNYRRATAADLTEIISKLGFSLSSTEQDALLNWLNLWVFNLTDTLYREEKKPPPSEVREMVGATANHAAQLLSSLGVQRLSGDIFRNGLLSQEINPTILNAYTEAAKALGLDATSIANAAWAVAYLAVLAGHAQQAAHREPRKRHPASHYLSISLAETYRNFFGREPKKTINGPWPMFLKWGLKIAGSPSAGREDGTLIKMPIRWPSEG